MIYLKGEISQTSFSCFLIVLFWEPPIFILFKLFLIIVGFILILKKFYIFFK